MDLELATTLDILKELLRRQMRFTFVGIEASNSQRDPGAYIAGQGFDLEDVVRMIAMGQAALQRLDEEDPDEDG